MRQKIVTLFLLLSLLVPLHMAAVTSLANELDITGSDQQSSSLVYIGKHARESITRMQELLPDHSWSSEFRNLNLDIQDGGTVASYQYVDLVINECLAVCNNQQSKELRPLATYLEKYRAKIDSGDAIIQIYAFDDESAPAQTRSCSKAICKLCTRNLTVNGTLTVNGLLFVNGLAFSNLETLGQALFEAGLVSGATGPTGATGAAGATGATGATGSGGGVLSAAQYSLQGSQPATVAAGQPFTFSTTANIASADISATTAIQGGFTASGTVFTLGPIGIYEVNFQTNYPTPSGMVLYIGSTLGTMLPVAYTMVGKAVTDTGGQVSGSVIVQTTTANSFLALCAAAGNSSAIGVPPNSSTTNTSSTTISFKRIG